MSILVDIGYSLLALLGYLALGGVSLRLWNKIPDCRLEWHATQKTSYGITHPDRPWIVWYWLLWPLAWVLVIMAGMALGLVKSFEAIRDNTGKAFLNIAGMNVSEEEQEKLRLTAEKNYVDRRYKARGY